MNESGIGSCAENRADLFLVDYEFLDSKQTGLDFILEEKLQHKAILVTSRYEEFNIQDKCESFGIGLIPKGLAPYVPILIESGVGQSVSEKLDAILVDDDLLVQMAWQAKASEKKLNIKVYSDPSEVDFDTVSKECPIYIDSSLKNGVKGEDLAEKLHRSGFVKIFLATGYEKERFAHLSFLSGVLGKEPPW
jgi:hypothetical protein